ncbi:MAG: dipeptidase [Candidatus Eremiobacterota bacterium]
MTDETMKFHMNTPVADFHADTLCKALRDDRSVLDIKPLLSGGVNLQVFALYTPEELIPHSAIAFTLEMIDLFYKWKEENRDVSLILSRNDLDILKNGKLGCLLSIEGGEALSGKSFMLDTYYRLGVRAMTLTWSNRNLLADGVAVGNNPGGLTDFGVKVVEKMNNLGMIVDVSHMAEQGFWDVMKLSSKPVIASHSNCYSLCNHPRNLKDEQILAIAEKGGVTGITFVPPFLGENPVTVEHVADHIEYIINLTGNYNSAGLGSDFHGTDNYPSGLSDASFLPAITEVLKKRGHSYKDIEKIIGGNWLRVLSQILK